MKTPPLNRWRSQLTAHGALFASLLAVASAQTAPAAKTDPAEPTLQLSPFEVSASTDSGYSTQDTLAGNRLRTSVRDVGSALSIYNSKFLSDIGANNAKDLLVYTTSGEVGGVGGNFSSTKNTGNFQDDTGGGSYVSPTGNTRIRGLSTADLTRDYFLSDIPFDTYNMDRVDIQRGANSILFGLASPGGVINYGLNQANFKNGGSVSLKVDQYGTIRSSLDLNTIVIPHQLALRVDLLNDETRFEQEQAWKHSKRGYATVRYEPALLNTSNMSTTFKASYEKGSIVGPDPQNIPPRDQITGWWTFANQAVNVPYAQYDAVQGKYVGYTNAALGYSNAGYQLYDKAGNLLPATNAWIGIPGRWREDIAAVFLNPNSSVMGGGTNYAWMQRAAYNTLAGENGNQLGQFRGLQTWGAVLGTAMNQAGFWKDASISDPSIFDFYHNTLGGPNRTNNQDFEAVNASINQSFFQNQIGYEVAFDQQRVNAKQANAFAWEDGNAIGIDINKTLPDGTPNANFGRPFVASDIIDNFVDFRTRKSTRATAYYDLDLQKKINGVMGKILGRHMFTGLWSTQSDNHKNMRYSSSVTGADYLQLINQTGNVFNWSNIDRLTYLGASLANASSAANAHISGITVIQEPQNGQTGLVYNPNTHQWITNRPIETINDNYNYGTFSPAWSKQTVDSAALVWQGHMFEDVLVPTIGWRRDTAKVYQSTTAPVNKATGFNIVDDPALWYLKDSPSNTIKGDNVSYSVVAHTPKAIQQHLPAGMDVDLTFNKSENFSPSASAVDIYGRPQPAQTGTTKDYGITVSFLDRKLSFRAIKFESAAQNAASSDVNKFFLVQTEVDYWNAAHNPYNIANNPAAVAAYNNAQVSDALKTAWNWSIATNPVTGQQTANATTPPGFGDLADTTSKGYEFEVMANPMKGLNIMFNASKTEASLTNNLKDLETYMNDRLAVWQGVAGTMLSGPTATQNLIADHQGSLFVPYATALARNGFMSQELRKWRWNLLADYHFSSGSLKGFSIGGGVRWQDKVAIGYALTSNGAGGWRYDLTKPYFGPSETNYDLHLAYERKLTAKLNWKVQFNARDLFQKDHLIAIQAQPDGSTAQFRIAPETTYMLTNTISF